MQIKTKVKQSLLAKMNLLGILVHLTGTILFGYSLYYDLMFVHTPPHLRSKFKGMIAFPGKWKYLTVWDEVLQLTYHSLALLNDLLGSSEVDAKKRSVLQKCRDCLFASWAFPIGTFVSISFWGLYALDRALVFPKELDEFFPAWLNHAVHTAPIVLMLLEGALVPKAFPSMALGIPINLAFSATYISWITWVNKVSGVWAYPILDVLDSNQRIAFKGACAIAILLCFIVGSLLNNWRWRKALEGKGGASKAGKQANKGKKKVK